MRSPKGPGTGDVAGAGGSPSGTRRWLRRIGLALASTTILLSVTECGVRLVCPDRHNVWPSHFDPRIGMVTDAHATVRWAGGSSTPREFDVVSRANSLGFPDVEPPEGPKREFRVVMLGDSFVEGLQVPLEARMARRLESLLASSAPARVVAFGRSSTGPAQQWAYLEHLGFPLDPDVVVSVVINNDLRNDSAELESVQQGWHREHSPFASFELDESGTARPRPPDPEYENFFTERDPRVPREGLLAAVVPRLERRSKAFAVATRMFRNFRWWNDRFEPRTWMFVEGLPVDFHFYRPPAELPAAHARAVALSDAVVGHYSAELRRRSIRWVVAYVPSARDFDDAPREICGHSVDPRAQREIWGGFCARRGVEFLDLTAPLSANPDGNPGRYVFAWDGHLNEAGHDAVARALADALRDRR